MKSLSYFEKLLRTELVTHFYTMGLEIIDKLNCNFEMTWDQNKFDVSIIDSKKKKGAGWGH
jgi:hypothetical protein